jgi:chromosome segregation ATPase
MNEETTRELPGKSSFEERVFARFDSIDARFNTVDARFDAIDARFETVDARLEKLESRAYDTKPIWEKALAAIMQTGIEVGEIKAKVAVIETKVAVIETKVAVIETEVAGMKIDYEGIRNELTEMRRDLKYKVKKSIDLILQVLVEGRTDLSDAEDRIKQLETKLA